MSEDIEAAWADEEARDRRNRTVIQAVVGLLILIAAAVGLYLYHDHYGISTEERFERELSANPAALTVLGPIRQYYPYEYSKLRRETAESYNLEKRGLVLDRLPEGFLEGFLKRHAVEALQGGDHETITFIDAYAAFFAQAEHDKALCEVIYGSDNKIADPGIVLKLPPFTRMYAAFVALAASGRKNPIRHDPPSRADMQSFSTDYLRLRPKGKTEWPISPQQRCAEANATAKAILMRPEDQRIRLISVLFQQWR